MPSETQLLIVGSGVAGALVAELALAAGVQSVVMLEAGPSVPMRDQRVWLDRITRGILPYTNLYDLQDDFIATGVQPWQISGGRLFGRGGSMIHWGGWCPRFMPEDFALKTNTGIGIDWPYSYADLERYYVSAERYLQVAGTPMSGQRDWRSAPYPFPAAPLPLTAGRVIDALVQYGYSYQHMPVARNTEAINGHPACATVGTCDYCPIGARFTGDQPLDRLARNTRFQLHLGAPVQQVLMRTKDTAAGVRYRDLRTGEIREIYAKTVFLCAGALETPKLLLASTTPDWPNGVGNANDLVGRFLVANPYLYCRGSAGTNPFKLQQEINFPTLCSRQWDTPAEQAHGKYLMNMSYAAPLLAPGKLMYQGQTAVAIAAATTGPVSYELQGGLSPLPFRENRVKLSAGETRFGLPKTAIDTPTPMVPQITIDLHLGRTRQVMGAMGFTVSGSGAYPQRGDHAASTCRMARAAEQGVVDPTMLVYGTKNVYVASNAALPTIGAANVTLTLVAAIMKSFEIIVKERRLTP